METLPEMTPNVAQKCLVPTNLDLANSLGMMDFDFEKLHFGMGLRAGLRGDRSQFGFWLASAPPIRTRSQKAHGLICTRSHYRSFL